METKITVLCVNEKTIYKDMGLDCYDQKRDAYNFTGNNPVITHAPCAQWSVCKPLAKVDAYQKELAFFCLEKVQSNGGIFEHPANSSFFKTAGIKPTISIDQSWFGFPARKPTWLFFSKCKPLPVPLRFEAIQKKVEQMWSHERSITTKDFALWMIKCIQEY